jgi:guanylate kinase
VLVILSAPSGAGKTTVAHRILRLFPPLRFSVSATTRARRPRERDGADYSFLTRERFEQSIREGGFVEWEEIFGNLYGTPVAEIDRAIAEGRHLLFDIDVKGALAIATKYPGESVTIFIRPPDLETLRRRLRGRGTDTPQVVETRIARAEWELTQASLFSHAVTNDDLDRCVSEVAGIVAECTGLKPEINHEIKS